MLCPRSAPCRMLLAATATGSCCTVICPTVSLMPFHSVSTKTCAVIPYSPFAVRVNVALQTAVA
jgi:hypothetical protein